MIILQQAEGKGKGFGASGGKIFFRWAKHFFFKQVKLNTTYNTCLGKFTL